MKSASVALVSLSSLHVNRMIDTRISSSIVRRSSSNENVIPRMKRLILIHVPKELCGLRKGVREGPMFTDLFAHVCRKLR